MPPTCLSPVAPSSNGLTPIPTGPRAPSPDSAARFSQERGASWSLPLWESLPAPGAPAGLAPTLPGPGQLTGSRELVGEVSHTFQELDLIHSCLRVMPCALHHFQGHKALAPATPETHIGCQPHANIMVAPTKPRGRIPAGTGTQGANGTLTGCPSRARR